MTKIINTNLIIIVAALLSMALTIYGMAVAANGLITGTGIYQSWMFIFSILVAMWASFDTELSQEYKFSGYGFLVLILWPLVLLYHLIKSRGIEGFLVYMGFWALYVCPNFFNIIMQFYV
jgi:hypothetical protein